MKKEWLAFVKYIFKPNDYPNYIEDIESNIIQCICEHGLYAYIHESDEITISNIIREFVHQRYIEILERVDADIKIIQKICSNQPQKDELIVIKGIVPYMLTGDCSLLKYSNDLDIIFKNPKSISEAVSKAGGSKLNESCSSHEEGKYVVDNRKIEAHYYFPIVKLPAKPLGTSQGLIQIKIEYSDIYEESEVVQGIRMPNLEMTVFLLAVHIYKDFYWQPYEFPGILLCDLYAIYNLSQKKQFRIERFKKIVNKFDAWQIISFIKTIADCFFEKKLFKALESNLTKVDAYMKLVNNAYSSYVKLDDKDYFEKLPAIEFEDIISNLCPSVVHFNTRYNSSQVRHFKFSELDKGRCEYSFEFQKKGNIFEVTFYIEEMLNNRDSVYILMKNNYAHIRYFEEKDNQIFGLYNATYHLQTDDNGTIVSYLFKDTPEDVLRAGAVLAVERCVDEKITQVAIPVIFNTKDN